MRVPVSAQHPGETSKGHVCVATGALANSVAQRRRCTLVRVFLWIGHLAIVRIHCCHW